MHQRGLFNKLIKNKYSTASARKWVSVVGLEVHAQISSESKLFSSAENAFAKPINANVALLDCAMPGTLPVLNKKCVEAGVLTALSLNCRVNPVSMFDRKHYFYADMPAGYQITQQRSPIASDGYVSFHVFVPGVHKSPYSIQSKIKQIQLEQDSGKSLHDIDRSLVDLNRAGAPLMELVFEPDLADGEEAAALVKELSVILRRLGTCSCKMEEGALRVDANISVHQKGDPLGTRTEVKNIGSVRGVAGAVKYEIDRQIALLESGDVVINETRAWNAQTKQTVAMRDKEQTIDYRYMPEPNLPPLHINVTDCKYGDSISVEELKLQLPEMPEVTRTRLKSDEFGLTSEQAIILVNEPILLNLFNEAFKDGKLNAKKIANLLINDYLAILHKENVDIENQNVDGAKIRELAGLIQDGVINKNSIKLVFAEIIRNKNVTPKEVVDKNNLAQITDEKVIEALCQKVLEENPKVVEKYRNGKVKVFKALQGAVFKSNETIDMVRATKILQELIYKKKV